MARSVRMAPPARALLLLLTVLVASSLAGAQTPAGNSTAPSPTGTPPNPAPGGTAGGTAGGAAGGASGSSNAIALDLYEFESGSTFLIEPSGIALIPGENVTLNVHNIGQQQHNLYIGDGGAVAKIDPLIDPGKSASVSFQVPTSGTTVYYCNVPGHRELGMQGNLTLKGAAVAAPTGGPGVNDITKLGVNYYAYWVGVIAFIVLFAVLAVTFFVLRYGESQHWTDWRDRPSRPAKEGEAPPRPIGTWVAMALVLIVALVAAAQVVNLVR
jgi:plastocyanin